MRAKGNRNATAAERTHAVRMVVENDLSPAEVAEAIGRCERTVQKWLEVSGRGKKPAALRGRRPPGPKAKLCEADRRRLLKKLKAGPEAAGFGGQLWTGPRVAELIRREFGVSYHPEYVPRLLRALGWTPQIPRRRAAERDEGRIARWKRRDWPRIKKKPAG